MLLTFYTQYLLFCSISPTNIVPKKDQHILQATLGGVLLLIQRFERFGLNHSLNDLPPSTGGSVRLKICISPTNIYCFYIQKCI